MLVNFVPKNVAIINLKATSHTEHSVKYLQIGILCSVDRASLYNLCK
jgi:hypothetical protein